MDQQTRKNAIREYKSKPLIGGICFIKNKCSGHYLLDAVTDPKGSESRFEFARKVGSCISPLLQKDWSAYGAESFTFEILDTIEQKETETEKEFRENLAALGEMWAEKFDPELSYRAKKS